MESVHFMVQIKYNRSNSVQTDISFKILNDKTVCISFVTPTLISTIAVIIDNHYIISSKLFNAAKRSVDYDDVNIHTSLNT